MQQVQPEVVKKALLKYGGEQGREVAKNDDLLARLVDVLNATVQMGGGKVSDVVLGFAEKTASVAGIAAKSRGAKAGVAAVQINLQTLALIKLGALGAKATPTVVIATAGAMLAKKTALAFGLAADDKQAKLIGACAEVAASVGTVVATVAVGMTPIGWVAIAAAVASASIAAHGVLTDGGQETAQPADSTRRISRP